MMAKFVNQYKNKKAFSFFHMLENNLQIKQRYVLEMQRYIDILPYRDTLSQ